MLSDPSYYLYIQSELNAIYAKLENIENTLNRIESRLNQMPLNINVNASNVGNEAQVGQVGTGDNITQESK